MRGMTIAQTLLAFDAMAQYHALLNGGGGTGSGSPASSETRSMKSDAVVASQSLRDSGMFGGSSRPLTDEEAAVDPSTAWFLNRPSIN